MFSNNPNARRSVRARLSPLVLVAITIIAAAALIAGLVPRSPPPDSFEPRPVVARGSLAEDEKNAIEVFQSASLSTVHIRTAKTALELFSLDLFTIPQGTGSGFIWDEYGHIVTNYHVIQGADHALVTLADQTTWKAAIVAVYPDKDLAVLRIGAPRHQLKPIAIGESRTLQVGQKVYAIGNPFGLDQTLTAGIVSALNREIQAVTGRTIRGVIQTDAAINPGNSGGPLLDSAGRLIGVNTAIYSPSGAFAGIGFAIPVDEVNRLVPRLIRDGRVIRPILGIRIAPPAFTAALGISSGVAIIGVDPDGPAARAGLQPWRPARDGRVVVGDLIIALNGHPTPDRDTLLDLLERHQPGETVLLTIDRAGERREVPVTLDVSS
ncbi:MAG: trypsin-like peptidase domain-containing protein [Hydrogenophilus sp.]|nr:trypsin-like peptidase domain-containing protein [Hydrogenophilus sp.]